MHIFQKKNFYEIMYSLQSFALDYWLIPSRINLTKLDFFYRHWATDRISDKFIWSCFTPSNYKNNHKVLCSHRWLPSIITYPRRSGYFVEYCRWLVIGLPPDEPVNTAALNYRQSGLGAVRQNHYTTSDQIKAWKK